MHSFHYNHGTFHCEEVDLTTVAKEVGTPAYVYSAKTVLENYRRLNQALNPLDRMICYAAKANSNLAILGLLAKEGAGFDIVSGGELFKVLKAGGRADRCTFAGVGKMVFEIEYALKQGIYCFNVESEGELELINEVAERLGCVAPIALRVNPDVDAPTHHYISTGKSKNKFGIGLDRAEAVYARAAALPYLKIRGLQTHIGSQILDAAPFAEAVHKLTPLVRKLQKLYGLEFFSIGGGVGIGYRGALASDPACMKPMTAALDSKSFSGSMPLYSHPQISSSALQHRRPASPDNEVSGLSPEAYAAQVIEPLRALGLRILFEPGRFIVGNAGVLLTTVLYRKSTPAKNFLIVDAGMNDLIRPALYQGYHEIEPLREPIDRPLEKIDVVGPVCESGDFFAQDRMIPRVEPGEQVALMSTGAYGLVMGSNYNARPMPPEVLVEGKKATVVRRRQTWEDLISLEVHIRPTGQI
ncbi:MAG: diaminopimelate decarboxylase [Verrucomicrobia bacterium RIFCSPHIGHO2_12_FULL_41_10]|nr:MAG: diaminopimelate decarboxylase [Verrucomicrobia bacterium RIFCSPHIGHO2_12_FULL_41_10]HLB34753.1 diaminopimelate decarboxylase [Chthoniobacterales bacterium]